MASFASSMACLKATRATGICFLASGEAAAAPSWSLPRKASTLGLYSASTLAIWSSRSFFFFSWASLSEEEMSLSSRAFSSAALSALSLATA